VSQAQPAWRPALAISPSSLHCPTKSDSNDA